MLRPRYPRYPSDTRLGGRSENEGREKNTAPAGNRISVVRPVVSNFTN